MSPKDRKRSEYRRRRKSSSSFADSGSASEHDIEKKRKHKENFSSSSSSDAEYDQRKCRKRRQHGQNSEREGKHLPHSSNRFHRSRHVDEVAYGSPSPEEIVCTMLRKFPELANDLEQLLKMLDDGQAVGLSGLTNEHIAAYLQQLFKALLLHKTTQELYYLPDRASNKTLQVLGPALRSASQALVQDPDEVDRSKQDKKVFEPAANKVGLCDHEQRSPCEQKRSSGLSCPTPCFCFCKAVSLFGGSPWWTGGACYSCPAFC